MPRTVVKKRTEAILKAIGVFLGVNAFVFAGAFIRGWLEIKPRPSPLGFIFVAEGLLLLVAIQYYRRKVKGD